MVVSKVVLQPPILKICLEKLLKMLKFNQFCLVAKSNSRDNFFKCTIPKNIAILTLKRRRNN